MNFKRILSKSSLRSSASSGKSLIQVNEVKKLRDEIESLNLNITSLKVLLESRDAAIGNLAREKEKLYVEHKSLQRANSKLQQELVDERVKHSKEKDFLLESMKKLSLKLANSGNPISILDEEEHISALQNEIKSKDEVIYNVCSKYMKLRNGKEDLQKNFELLQRHTHETFETIITTLEDNKNSLDLLFDELRKSAKSNPSHKQYNIKLMKNNADLNIENTQLKLFLIAKNVFSSDVKEVESSGIDSSQCTQSDVLEIHKNLQREKSTNSVERIFGRSKTSASKVVGVFSKLKSINAFSKYNKKIRYRTMSDSLLPKDFYK